MTDPANLQNLHPIVSPPQAGFWPPAPGWYLLVGILVIIAARSLYTYLQNKRANRYRKYALQRLAVIRSEMREGKAAALRELPILVKAVALEVYPRPEIAGLHGKPWLEMLDGTIDSTDFSDGPGRLLPKLAYQSPEELAGIEQKRIDELTVLIEHWLQNHRPPTSGEEVSRV